VGSLFVCLIWKQALPLRLGEVAMAALVGNFLFVSNIGNQAALPSVLQEERTLNTVAMPFAPCMATRQC